MRFLIVNTDYAAFLNEMYTSSPELAQQSYDVQRQVRLDTLFGVSQYYASNLNQLGHPAWDVYANNQNMQLAWAKAHGYGRQFYEAIIRLRKGLVPWPGRRIVADWYTKVLARQIEYYKPDVLLIHAMDTIDLNFLRTVKPQVSLLVGQHAATELPAELDYTVYDIVLSSFGPTVDRFRAMGLQAELHLLGFEATLAKEISVDGVKSGISFVGSFNSKVHESRRVWLEDLCRAFPEIEVWGPGLQGVSDDSPIRACYRGRAWGREMYEILRKSAITLNHHGSIEPYANNLRLYEATGMGSLLITDWKPNLDKLFKLGEHLVAYRYIDECINLIGYYLSQEDERAAIAESGQRYVLARHSFKRRMQELVDIIEKHA